jgi:Family of unknown function (DUF6847)
MKLAEALILRADLQKRVEQLRTRLTLSAKIQEGEAPPENPNELIAELERLTNELLDLVKRINRTNVLTPFEGGQTLADALATRDVLMLKRGVYSSLADAASVSFSRYSRSEIKYFSTVNVAEIQKRVEDLSRQHRELDAKIQAANWNTDLVE